MVLKKETIFRGLNFLPQKKLYSDFVWLFCWDSKDPCAQFLLNLSLLSTIFFNFCHLCMWIAMLLYSNKKTIFKLPFSEFWRSYEEIEYDLFYV